MPKMDGFAVLKETPGPQAFKVWQYTNLDPNLFFSKIPVLMLIVFPGDREKAALSVQEGMTMEAEDYIQKLVSPEELLRRAEKLLKKHG